MPKRENRIYIPKSFIIALINELEQIKHDIEGFNRINGLLRLQSVILRLREKKNFREGGGPKVLIEQMEDNLRKLSMTHP